MRVRYCWCSLECVCFRVRSHGPFLPCVLASDVANTEDISAETSGVVSPHVKKGSPRNKEDVLVDWPLNSRRVRDTYPGSAREATE
jgi:hypothetical protein